MRGDLRFRLTTGAERYTPLGEERPVPIAAGEYACLDDEKVLCRLDVKQCQETRITKATTEFLVYVQGNPATREEDLLAGLHWASLAWKPTPIDIGVGYVGSARQVVPGYSARTVDATPFDNQLRLDGGYLELGKTLQGSSRHWRTWLSARGELLHGSVNDRSFSAIGGAVRVSSEVYLSGAAGGRNAIICGTLALGIYVEASHRDIAPELGRDVVTSGVSIRLPFILAGS